MSTAVLTGVGAGFGCVLAKTFYDAGYTLVLSDIDYDAACRLAAELDPAGDRSFAARLDIRSEQDYQRVLKQAVDRWGSVEALINNAAVTKAQPLLDIEPAEFNEVMATNAGGVFTGCRVFGRYFKSRSFGRIVNLASLAGQNGGTATGAHYAASKGAILTLTKIFARELGPFGVTVNAVAPGPMDTPLVHRLVPPAKMVGFLENIPVHQLICPEFVASVIRLLAAPEAATVSGACWDVNGGLFMR